MFVLFFLSKPVLNLTIRFMAVALTGKSPVHCTLRSLGWIITFDVYGHFFLLLFVCFKDGSRGRFFRIVKSCCRSSLGMAKSQLPGSLPSERDEQKERCHSTAFLFSSRPARTKMELDRGRTPEPACKCCTIVFKISSPCSKLRRLQLKFQCVDPLAIYKACRRRVKSCGWQLIGWGWANCASNILQADSSFSPYGWLHMVA